MKHHYNCSKGTNANGELEVSLSIYIMVYMKYSYGDWSRFGKAIHLKEVKELQHIMNHGINIYEL